MQENMGVGVRANWTVRQRWW
uniref:Uncharacterized protein n=1 Tax=Arundo donax TaxID=35708 RepID=A0A0A8ZVH5_ARUDO